MAFGDELSGKVAEIREKALDHFENIIRHSSARLDEGRTRVEPTATSTLDEEGLAGLQYRLDELLSDLDALERRFSKYYELNSNNLEYLPLRICPRDISHLGQEENTSTGPAPRDSGDLRFPVDRIDFASHLVTTIADPDMQAAPVWTGPAADAFNTNFLLPFQDVADRQVFCVVYMANVLMVFHKATAATEKDLKEIADATIAALEGEYIFDAAATSALLGILLDLLGFIPPLGVASGVASISLAVLSSGSQPPELPKWYVDSDSNYTTSIIEAAGDLLSKLEDALAERDDAVSRAITQDLDAWFQNADFQLRSRQPDPPDQIGQELVAEIQSIYEFGKRLLPTAADHYRLAVAGMDDVDVPPWFRRLIFPRSHFGYESGRASLTTALAMSQDQLLEAGRTLVDICNSYTWSDAAAEAEFDRFKERIPEGYVPTRPPHL